MIEIGADDSVLHKSIIVWFTAFQAPCFRGQLFTLHNINLLQTQFPLLIC